MINFLIIQNSMSESDNLSSIIKKYYPNCRIDLADTYELALEAAAKGDYSIFIIDLESNENNKKNGIWLGLELHKMEKYRNTPIILKSINPNHILNAVNSLNLIYYLIKPFSENDILNMLQKITGYKFIPKKLVLKNIDGIRTTISIENIIYAHSRRHQIDIFLIDNFFTCCNYTLETLLKDCDGTLTRCHKSYIVNKDFIKYVDKTTYYLTLHNLTQPDSKKITLPLGRTFAASFCKK